jgi:hypothetical protein
MLEVRSEAALRGLASGLSAGMAGMNERLDRVAEATAGAATAVSKLAGTSGAARRGRKKASG